ncbi:MFS transporter [Streptomyces indicus]|uniref:Predicted arabinose efflux permease, MFS family n=1 Tax=Streptomyces indicus TaxID=417292 RepID=A0A1G9FH40_9ACTN|nr:MFS transporter [Streptomyces indicus]SDK87745.1 Predicted arabinose efflux permease, MFS family [Streptomyces indicus]
MVQGVGAVREGRSGAAGGIRAVVPRSVWLLAAGVFFNALVSFTFVYVFLYLTGPRGLSVAEAGLISGLGGLGLIAGNFTGGWYGDHFGHRRVLLAAAVAAGLVLAVLPLLPFAALYLALPLAQYAAGVLRAANSALVAVLVPQGARRQAFAVIRAASNGGITVGPPLGALVATSFSYDWLFVADGIGTLLFAWWTARRVPAGVQAEVPVAAPERSVEAGAPGAGAGHADPPAPEAAGGKLWPELRSRPAVLVLLGAILLVDLVYRQQYTTFPVHLAEHGMDARVYGWMIAINGGLILLLELPVALALKDRPPLRIVGCGLVLVGAGYAALIPGTVLATAIATMTLLTLGEILYKTTATAYVADQAPDHVQGRFQSLYAGVSVSGTVLAAPIGGAVLQSAPGLLWPLCAVLAVGAGCAVLLAGRMRERPAAVRVAGGERIGAVGQG